MASGVSPDSAVFIPYSTGLKYVLGRGVRPTITVVAEDVNDVEEIVANVGTVLNQSYPGASFTISDAGSKMEAATASTKTMTLLLVSMASIVFVVGGIGIMNVLRHRQLAVDAGAGKVRYPGGKQRPGHPAGLGVCHGHWDSLRFLPGKTSGLPHPH